MALDLTLLIPGLFGIKAEGLFQGLSLTAIERILSRSKRVEDRFTARSLEGMLFRAARIPAGVDGEWPVGAVCWHWEEHPEYRPELELSGEQAGHCWYMRADPAHARAGLGELTLMHSHELTISPQEARTLVASINEHFAEERWKIEAPHPRRWYIRCDTAPGIHTTPLSQVTGPVTDEFLPQGDQASYWRSVLNEIQMLLHSHSLNDKRVAEEKLPINSVWIWGVGQQPTFDKSHWDTLCSDLHVGRSVAGSTGMTHTKACDGLSNVLHSNRCLVVIDCLDLPSRRVDLETWRTGIERLAKDWFQPLLDALRTGAVTSLEISLGNGTAFYIKHSRIRNWWRRHRSFAEIAQT